jgi:hypothetical protein
MERKGRVFACLLVLVVGLSLAPAGCDLAGRTTPGTIPPPTAVGTVALPAATAQPAESIPFSCTDLPLAISRPKGWLAREAGGQLLLAANAGAVAGAELEGPALVVSRVEGAATTEEVLARVALEGAQVLRRERATLGGEEGRLLEAVVQGPASGKAYRLLLVVVVHGGKGYLAAASAPVEQWEAARADLQGMIESVTFR